MRVDATFPAASTVVEAAAPATSALASLRGQPGIKSSAALVVDQADGSAIYSKNSDSVVPIASITKLMTAMVVLDSKLPLDEYIDIDKADLDSLKHTRSKLRAGTDLSRRDMLQLALMASENRAAFALARNYPGSTRAFVAAMNSKAQELGMWNTHFEDPTGLTSHNVSTANDLAKMVEAAYQYRLIREFTTTSSYDVRTGTGRRLEFHNTNRLVRNSDWDIGLSKTGYISEAGRCLVMQAKIASRPVVIVLLDSWGKYTRLGDAKRIKSWLEQQLVRK